MPKTYIFIHNLETNEVNVISRIPRRDYLWGKYIEHHFYKIFFSKHKKLVCSCPHNNYQEGFCNHRKMFLKLLWNLEQLPLVKTETLELMIASEIDTV